jgi:drug/metabolite transporter (DMT)-like permease
MRSLKSVVTKERGALAGDACLVTAAAFGLVTDALALTFMPEGEPPEDMTWVQLFSALFSLAVVIVGPLVAWRLHGRRLTWMAVLGAVMGLFVVMSAGEVSYTMSLRIGTPNWLGGSVQAPGRSVQAPPRG